MLSVFAEGILPWESVEVLITDNEFLKLSQYIRDNIGIDLSEKKKNLLSSRLGMVIETGKFGSFSAYYDYVVSDKTGKAINQLIDKITTNHTYFYREKQHYEYLTSDVLPYLVNTNKDHRDLRIWSAGCSSGEEPYTIAMVLADFLGNRKTLWDSKILATDISNKVLTKAKEGIYTEENLKNNPPLWNYKYFKPQEDEKFVISDPIKKEVIFRRLNLLSPFNFKKKFHIIFCRNVMIYFDAPTRNNLVKKFYDILEPGGYFFISHSESIDRNITGFKYVKPSIYRKEI